MAEKFLLKVIFAGDGGVGKTSLSRRYVGEGFTGTYLMTIGADFRVKTLELDDGTEVSLQLWDSAGQERFSSIRSYYYTGSHGIVLVYDITRPESLQNLAHWFDEGQKNVKRENVSYLVLGNKTDLVDQRLVSPAEGRNFATSIGAIFAETSAKTGKGIDKAMMGFVEEIISSFSEQAVLPETGVERKLTKTTVHPLLLDDGEIILFELKEPRT